MSLEAELPSQQFMTWIKPLELVANKENDSLHIVAPNRFIKDWVKSKYLPRVEQLIEQFSQQQWSAISCDLATDLEQSSASKNNGNINAVNTNISQIPEQQLNKPAEINQKPINQPFELVDDFSPAQKNTSAAPSMNNDVSGGDISEAIAKETQTANVLTNAEQMFQAKQSKSSIIGHESNVIADYTFDSFVEGKSNQLARAAAMQVADNPGGSYNPLFLYGGVGLGKTHLMHSVGNALLAKNPDAKIVYLHSERFVADMVKALQLNAINDFKRYYRSVDALLIDDIQFFAGKERSQEEFFHTFNALLESGQQIILTCDRYPKEIKGLEERLKSRFSWGLSVAVEPPELETRVAILMKKAEQHKIHLPKEAAFFIAQRLRSNVRELEGALKRVIAQAEFKKRPIDVELIKESLRDLLSLQDRLVSVDNIQKTVAEYYKIKVSDLHSKRRNRSIARPRQVAMSLAKELTSHSLPEIGDAFGGRDHTTVLHACRKIEELKGSNTDVEEDVKNLLRILTT